MNLSEESIIACVDLISHVIFIFYLFIRGEGLCVGVCDDELLTHRQTHKPMPRVYVYFLFNDFIFIIPFHLISF